MGNQKEVEKINADQIFEIVHAYNRGLEVWGNKENFERWLVENNLALGGVKPIELLFNSIGVVKFNDEIGRIEHGVFS